MESIAFYICYAIEVLQLLLIVPADGKALDVNLAQIRSDLKTKKKKKGQEEELYLLLEDEEDEDSQSPDDLLNKVQCVKRI